MADTSTPTVRRLTLYVGLPAPFPVEVETQVDGQLPHTEVVTVDDLDAQLTIAGQQTTLRAYMGTVGKGVTAVWNAALATVNAANAQVVADLTQKLTDGEAATAKATEAGDVARAALADARAALAKAQQVIRSGLLTFDAAQDDWRQSTATANGYIDWLDLLTNARTDGGPWQTEATAIVREDTVTIANSIVDAQKDGKTTPAAWRAATPAWIYVEPPADNAGKPE